MECFPEVTVQLSELSEVFGIAFAAGAGAVLTVIPVRVLVRWVSSMYGN